MKRLGVLALAVLGAGAFALAGGDEAPAEPTPTPTCGAEPFTVQVAGPRGFVTSDEWCARLSR